MGVHIVIAEPSGLLRAGLQQFIRVERDDWTVRDHATIAGAWADLCRTPADVLLVAAALLRCEASYVIDVLRKEFPDLRIGILSESDDEIQDCLNIGAHGCVLKSDTPKRLLHAVQAIAAVSIVAPLDTGRATLARDRGTTCHLAEDGPPLTARQREVLDLLGRGSSTKEIARGLGLAVPTVKGHLAMLYRALGARNRVEAVVRAGHAVAS